MLPPYAQPDFATLYDKSKHLKKNFYGLAELFLLFSKKERDKIMGWSELSEEVSSLATKYTAAEAQILQQQSYVSWGFRLFGKAASSVGLSPTDRTGQIAAITDLIPLLKPKTAATESKDVDALKDDKVRIYTLLGALFYRLLRITNDYSSLDEAIAQSALCRAIYQLLGLSPKNKLDDWTVMTCCQYFYEYIEKDDTGARVRYIKDDDKFLDKLKLIISEARARANRIIEQLTYIDFVQSVAKTLADFESKLFPLLDGILEQKLAISSSKGILIYLEQQQGLLPCHHAYLKLVVANDKTEFSKEGGQVNVPQSLEQAIAQIKHRVASRNEYTLVGAYLSVLMRCTEGIWPDKKIQQSKFMLYGLLNEVIVTADTGQLDFEARDISLTMLHQLINLPAISDFVDISCWEHVPYLIREIEQEKIAFAPSLAKERAQREEEQAHSLSMTA